jgi:hypothetical protein
MQLRRVAHWAGNLVLLSVSVVIALYLVEVYFAYEVWNIELGTTKRVESAAKANGATWDPRDSIEVVRDLRAEGKRAYPVWAPSQFWETDGIPHGAGRWMPLGGVSDSYLVFCQEQGPYMIYLSDEHGFHNPEGLYVPDGLDAAIVGDSFAHGACTVNNDDVASDLRRDGFKVLTFGIGGTGPFTYLAEQREYAKPLRPKTIFWFYYGVDIRDVVYEEESSILRHYVDDPDYGQNLFDRQSEIDSSLGAFIDGAYQETLADYTKRRQERRKVITARLIDEGLLLKRVREHLRNLGGRDVVTEGREQEKLALTRQVLTRAREDAAAWGGQVVFVYLPDWYVWGAPYDTYGIKVDDNFLLRRDVLKLAGELGLPIIDTKAEIFDKQADPLSLYNWRTYGHYNPKGYALIAERLGRFLREHR